MTVSVVDVNMILLVLSLILTKHELIATLLS